MLIPEALNFCTCGRNAHQVALVGAMYGKASDHLFVFLNLILNGDVQVRES